jgi:cell division protein FtsA
MIKKQYGTLLPTKNDYNYDHEQTISKVKVPLLGNESKSNEIPIIQIQPIIHARVEELLCIIKEKINSSGMIESIDGGIVITGGTSYTKGLQELANKIFMDIPIKISNPINIQNGYIDFNKPTLSTIVGLLKYALDTDPFFELDSNKELRKKVEEKKHLNRNTEEDIDENGALNTLKIESKPKVSIWDKIGKWL